MSDHVVFCHTCRDVLAVEPAVVRAEQVLWDHIDETGHDVARQELADKEALRIA